MEKKIELTSELLIQQLNHWILFPLALTVMGLTSRHMTAQPDPLLWIFCGLFPVVYYFLRNRVHGFPVFILLHMLAAVSLSLLLPAADPVSRIICVICGIYYMIHSFVLRIKDIPLTSSMHPGIAMGISIPSILILHHQGILGWDGYYIFTLAGSFGLYLVIYYLQHYLSFLTLNTGSAGHMPVWDMFSSGMRLVLRYALFSTVVMILCTNLTWLETIAAMAKQLALAVLRFFFSLFPDSQPETQILPAEPEAPPRFSDMVPPVAETEEPLWFWKFLETVAEAVLICLLAYVVLRAAVWLIRFIGDHFYGNIRRQTKDMETGISEIREKCGRAENGSAKKPDFSGFLTPCAQIRKLYRKKLLLSRTTLTGGNVLRLRLLTARESEQILGTEGMACIYEQARYSQREPTRADVKKMREAVR